MPKINLIGSYYVKKERYAIGWDAETHKIYISEETGDIRWIDTRESARREEDAKLIAEKYISQLNGRNHIFPSPIVPNIDFSE